MAFDNLGEREKQVLACLISHYVGSADPVGSRAIANKFKLGISPATIRNTMQDLEEMGLVLQPHTSAGRIPTDSGYRLFVDMLLGQVAISDAEKNAIDASIKAGTGGVESVLEQTTRVLADLSNQLGVSLTPKLDDSVLSRIELIKMADGKVLVVMAFSSGLARTILLEVETQIGETEMHVMSQVLNEKLAGLTLGHIRLTISERLAGTKGNPRLLRLFVDEQSEMWRNLELEKMHVGGTDNLINQPEFSDREKLQEVIRLLDDRNDLITLLRETSSTEGGIIITIGAENKALEIQSCSVVSAAYQAGQTTGTIGIIGPTRMPYGKLSTLVKYAARQLSRVLKSK